MTEQTRPLIPVKGGTGPLFQGARPLVFADRPLVVSWSPKTACTHVLMWFLHHQNLLPAALYYGDWPHTFRGQVYYRSLSYRRAASALRDSRGRGYTLLRVTRAPHRRLVSSFRHVMRHNLLQDVLDPALGRDTSVSGASLTEVGCVLEQHDLCTPSGLDMHICAQFHPLWDMPFDRVITLNLDDMPLGAGLRAVEDELGLTPSPVDDLPGLQAMRHRHYTGDAPHAGPAPVEDTWLTGQGETFPKSALERAAQTRVIAERLYAV
ncbi:hypothetical protein, partial [Puniceibacterium confluentis]